MEDVTGVMDVMGGSSKPQPAPSNQAFSLHNRCKIKETLNESNEYLLPKKKKLVFCKLQKKSISQNYSSPNQYLSIQSLITCRGRTDDVRQGGDKGDEPTGHADRSEPHGATDDEGRAEDEQGAPHILPLVGLRHLQLVSQRARRHTQRAGKEPYYFFRVLSALNVVSWSFFLWPTEIRVGKSGSSET